MSERLKKLIKPLIAAAAVIIVLVIAYLSGGDVSVDDKPVIKPAESTSATAAVSTVTERTASTTTAAVSVTSVKPAVTSDTITSVTKAESAVTSKSTTVSAVRKGSVTGQVTTAATASVTEAVTDKPVVTTAGSSALDTRKSCSISVSCATVFDNTDKIDPAILAEQPAGGSIITPVNVSINEGDTVFDVLKKVCSDNGIHLEYTKIAATNSFYIEGINNLYEFDAGNLSGWMYSVNGKFPQLSSSQYTVSDGDVIEFVYSCSIGVDVGDDYYTKAG